MDAELFARFGELESRHWWFVARREIVLGVIASHVQSGARLLDVGCGTGFFLDRARESYSTAGVDPSSIALAMCERRRLEDVKQGSATDLSSLHGERFDLVTLLDVIEHVDDDISALQAARATLVPGGHIVVTVPAFQFLWTAHDDLNHHRRRYTKHRLRTALEASGFDVVHITYFNCYLFPLAFLERIGKRLLRLDGGPDLSLPPTLLNRAMRVIFGAERQRLEKGRSFPVGLSVLAVGRVSADIPDSTTMPAYATDGRSSPGAGRGNE